MIPCDRRRQTLRNYLFDCLEDRVLLNGAPSRQAIAEIRAVPAAMTAPRNLRLSLKGYVQLINTSPQTYQLSLTGSARELGHLQVAGSYVASSDTATEGREVVQVSQGITSLIDSKGDLLYFDFSGDTVYGGHDTAKDQLSGDVTGGAGRFAGMTGTVHATGIANPHALYHFTLTVRLQPLE
jgi:hypothetical protein